MKNTKKFGFRGSGTIIIFLMIIAFVFAAMIACEGPEGQQGPAGKDGEDAISEVTRVTVDGVEQWAIDDVPTGIKIDGEAEIEVVYSDVAGKTPFPLGKGEYYANQTINLTLAGDGAKVIVKYKLYEKDLVQGTDYFLFYNNKKIPDTAFHADYPTAEEGNKSILIYGPAKEPKEIKFRVKAWDFSNEIVIDGDRYGIDLEAGYTASSEDKDVVDTANVTTGLMWQWYKNGVAVPGSAETGVSSTFEAEAYGSYKVGVKAVGFKEKFYDFEYDLEATFDDVEKLATFLKDSPATTSKQPYDVAWEQTSGTALTDGVRAAIVNGVKFITLNLKGAVTVTTLSGAFEDCSALVEITLPKSVTSVTARAFNNCPNLAAVYVEAGIVGYASATSGAESGILYTTGTKKLVFYPPKKVTSSIILPNDVVTVNAYSIAFIENLVNLTIGPSTSIEAEGITNCPNLTKVTYYPELVQTGINPTNGNLPAFAIRAGDLQFVIEQASHQVNVAADPENDPPDWRDRGGKAIYERIDEDSILLWKRKSPL
jgi:hypothetical protein